MNLTRVYSKGVNKTLKKLISQIKEKANESCEEIALLGKQLARRFAPRKSGKLIGKIRIRRDYGPSAVIFAGNPIGEYPGEPHKRNIKNFNLIRWMHTSPRAKYHFETGVYNFMDLTKTVLRRHGAKIAQTKFNQIKLR